MINKVILKNNLKYLRYFCTQKSKSHYVTTPIFYVNAAPHIGHLYSAVIADANCRYERLRQPETTVRLCTGTDEHGTKVQQAAAVHGVAVEKYCNDISNRYRSVFQQIHIENDDFIRTSDDKHKLAVSYFWRQLYSRGHLYSAAYNGWYCVSDETFLTDSQLRLDESTGTRYSLESGHPVEWTQETNYMFRLANFQSEVIYWVKQGGRIRPAKFEKILLDMLSEPLPDVSVSRPSNRVHWAIPVPDDDSQTVYVWLDALINYLSAVGYPDEKYRMHWPPKQQIIGKDILKFHGIYWPAFLIAAGLEPPQQLFVHSHWTVDGQKMSKSKHNVVDPLEAAKVYTIEGLRYFLLREGVAHSDGNYSSVKALRILNSELADTLGNLLSRACAKSLNPQQIYPSLYATELEELLSMDAAKRLQDALRQLEERCRQHYEHNNFYLVVDTVMSTLHAANNFFENSRPWELKSSNSKPNKPSNNDSACSSSGSCGNESGDSNKELENARRLETTIAMTMDTLRLCGIILQPIVPVLSARLLDKLSVPRAQRLWSNLSDSFVMPKNGNGETVTVSRPLATNTDAVLFRRILLKDASIAGDTFDQGRQLQQSQQQKQQKQTKHQVMKQFQKSTKAIQVSKVTVKSISVSASESEQNKLQA